MTVMASSGISVISSRNDLDQGMIGPPTRYHLKNLLYQPLRDTPPAGTRVALLDFKDDRSPTVRISSLVGQLHLVSASLLAELEQTSSAKSVVFVEALT